MHGVLIILPRPYICDIIASTALVHSTSIKQMPLRPEFFTALGLAAAELEWSSQSTKYCCCFCMI